MPGLILTAAGASTRFGDGPNKILRLIAGVTTLARAAEAFHGAFPDRPIVVTARASEIDAIDRLVATDPRLARAHVVEGGATRQESVRRGLMALPDTVGVVLVHDAARPLATRDLMRRIAYAAERDGAAAPALPVVDSVHRVDDDDRLVESYPRQSLRAVQTPQAAKAVLLRRAFAEAERRGFQATDEVSLLLAIGVPVTAVPGDPENIKITVPDDLKRAEEILEKRAALAHHTG